MDNKKYDWKSNRIKREWPYEGDIDDPEYIKDRTKLFAKSGNGWWWFVPNKIHKYKKMCRNRIRKREKNFLVPK